MSVNVAVRPRERTRPSTPEWASQNERWMMALRGQRGLTILDHMRAATGDGRATDDGVTGDRATKRRSDEATRCHGRAVVEEVR
jgi:hypothetical protein